MSPDRWRSTPTAAPPGIATTIPAITFEFRGGAACPRPAVAGGRDARVRKVYLLSGNTAELTVMLVAAIGGLPLLPLHLLWINVVVEHACGENHSSLRRIQQCPALSQKGIRLFPFGNGVFILERDLLSQ